MLIQIIVTIFIIFALSKAVLRFRRQEFTLSEFIIWFIFWLIVGMAFWLPDFLTRLANLLGIGRGADLVLYLGLVLVFYLIFRIYIRLEKIERDITKVVRKDALKEVEKNQK